MAQAAAAQAQAPVTGWGRQLQAIAHRDGRPVEQIVQTYLQDLLSNSSSDMAVVVWKPNLSDREWAAVNLQAVYLTKVKRRDAHEVYDLRAQKVGSVGHAALVWKVMEGPEDNRQEAIRYASFWPTFGAGNGAAPGVFHTFQQDLDYEDKLPDIIMANLNVDSTAKFRGQLIKEWDMAELDQAFHLAQANPPLFDLKSRGAMRSCTGMVFDLLESAFGMYASSVLQPACERFSDSSAAGFAAKTLFTMPLLLPAEGASLFCRGTRAAWHKIRCGANTLNPNYAASVFSMGSRLLANRQIKFKGTEVQFVALPARGVLEARKQDWRHRPLGEWPYLLLDAFDVPLDCPDDEFFGRCLLAYGIGEDGKAEVLGLSVARTPVEHHWREFLTSLSNRGIHGVSLALGSGQDDLRAVWQEVFPDIPRMEYPADLISGAESCTGNPWYQWKIKRAVNAILKAPGAAEARAEKEQAIADFQQKVPAFVTWLNDDHVNDGHGWFDRSLEHRMHFLDGLNHRLWDVTFNISRFRRATMIIEQGLPWVQEGEWVTEAEALSLVTGYVMGMQVLKPPIDSLDLQS